ncbi:hypothetical protein D9758_006965 [Tetrapyrgos nigripes]|uniref:Uncharacterized protein n=1 Tax=Tetrapyrgos nigripes TaxID=182062 RepID=A0A8H5GT06_9AGAR|nr:hypothetical protein D9758_006965 [Tetrapyrgos nigripes]
MIWCLEASVVPITTSMSQGNFANLKMTSDDVVSNSATTSWATRRLLSSSSTTITISSLSSSFHSLRIYPNLMPTPPRQLAQSRPFTPTAWRLCRRWSFLRYVEKRISRTGQLLALTDGQGARMASIRVFRSMSSCTGP